MDKISITHAALLALLLPGIPSAAPGSQPVVMTDPATGQPVEWLQPAQQPVPKAFGTQDKSILVLNALTTLTGYTAGDNDEVRASGGTRYCNAPCNLYANVSLPSGARIVRIEAELQDSTSGGGTSIQFNRCPFQSSSCTGVAATSTGISETPGITVAATDLDHTVDNSNNSYIVGVLFSEGTPSLDARSVRFYYERQISPAPASATFDDVPTSHPFFRHVEALADSGISAGCGGGSFCPDQAVTRGQMAVFLANALGLHWGFDI